MFKVTFKIQLFFLFTNQFQTYSGHYLFRGGTEKSRIVPDCAGSCRIVPDCAGSCRIVPVHEKKKSHNFPKKLFQKFLGEAHERAKALPCAFRL